MTGLALLPDWTLASVSHDRTIRLWDLHTFRLISTVQDAHATSLQGIDYSPDTNEIVTYAMDNLAYVWDAVRLQAQYALVGHTAEVTQVELFSCYDDAALMPFCVLLTWCYDHRIVTLCLAVVLLDCCVQHVLSSCMPGHCSAPIVLLVDI